MPVVVYELVIDNGIDNIESKVMAVADWSSAGNVVSRLKTILEQMNNENAYIHATKLYVNDLTGLLSNQQSWDVKLEQREHGGVGVSPTKEAG